MAKLTEVEMKMNLDASEAGKALKKFGGTLEEVAGEGVQPLNFAIGELEDRLYEMAAAGNSSSAEFKAMSAEVGKMKKVIIETDLAIDGMAQTTAQNMGGALTGVASGFEFAQGAMGAFGVSGEAVEESLLKVQSAMAMAQGLQGLKEGMIAFKALRQSITATTVTQKLLNLVMKANPVGLIIAGVTALAAAVYALREPIMQLMEWMGLIDRTAERQAAADEKRAEERKAQLAEERRQLELNRAAKERAFNEEQGALDRQIALYQAQGKDVTELVRLKTEASIANVKNNLKEIESLLKLQLAMKEVGEKASTNMAKAIGKGNEDAASDTAKAVSEMKEEILNFENDMKIASIGAGKRAKDKADAAIAENKRKLDEIAKQEADALKKAWELDNQVRAREAEQKELLRSINATDEENELAALRASYAAKFELAQGNFELQIALKKELMDAEVALKEEQSDKLKALEQKEKDEKDAAIQKEKDDNHAAYAARVGMATDALDAINGLVQAFAGDNEKAQRKAFKIDKAVNLAKAIMNTSVGVSQALASGPPPLSFVQAGITAASGAAQIATIAKTKFQGGSTGGGSAGGSAPSLPSASSSPTFNVIGDSGTNQLAESLGGPQKAYVVSSDVTTAQSLDRNKIENASI